MKAGHHAKLQHYVPQFLLKNFCHGKKGRLWVFDKQRGRKFSSNVKNIASETKFNDLTLDGVQYTMEPWLSKLESRASRIVKDIITAVSIACLNDRDRLFLSFFLAVQFLRTKQQGIDIKQFLEAVMELVRESGGNRDRAEGVELLNEESLSQFRALSVARANESAPYFYAKTWLLLQTTKNCPLYMSDNPITLQNSLDHSPFGSLGLAVEGIEVYVPLSASLCLALYCPTIERRLRQAIRLYNRLAELKPGLLAKSRNPNGLNELVQGMDSGDPVLMNPEQVLRLNWLQVAYSSRFVFSADDDFSSAEKMIAYNPSYKEAPKIVFGSSQGPLGSDNPNRQL